MGETVVLDGQEQTGEPKIEKLFKIMVRQNASDLHLKVGQPPVLRIGGVLRSLKSDLLTDAQIQKLMYELLKPDQIATFERIGSFDFSYEFEGGWRVRINIYKQRGHISVACRLVQSRIPTVEELHLPPSLIKIAEMPIGLVLVVGATGTGKSTTLAAMIQHINNTRRCHILTVEDPIEYSFKDNKSLVNQREIGIDVPDWLSALKYGMREDPNVILIGEMRDPETLQAGLTAAETGHLVFGTLHASNCYQAFSRMLEMFPVEKHPAIRQGLSANLAAIVAQMLLPSSREGIRMVPAVEVLICNSVVKNLIGRGEDEKIAEVIRGSSSDGMQDMTAAIAKLVKEETVLRKVALENAPNRERLEMELRGISSDRGKIIG
ncbi:MAG: type IV pilus twitching motility protein PilT [Candidatus Brocadiia bacterium]